MTASELTERVSGYGSNMGAKLRRAVTPSLACRREPTGMSSSMDGGLHRETRQLNRGVPGVQGCCKPWPFPTLVLVRKSRNPECSFLYTAPPTE